MSTADFESDNRGFDDDRGYDRERDALSRSPRGADSRARSASPGDRDRGDTRPSNDNRDRDDESTNPGTNLFVTGIHPKLTEQDVTKLFEKYGEVSKANIMRDPHSGESRGFGFVNMVTAEHADAAREALQGLVHEGRTLSIEKARRARPRTPTPGKYYGPPKREFGGGGRRGGGRFEDRRGGYGGRRDDFYGGGGGGGGGYRGSRDDRGGDGGYDRRYRDRGDRGDRGDYGRSDRYGGGPPREDRYGGGGGGGGRDDRYGGGRDDRRGGYYGREDRGYDQGPPRESRDPYAGSRSYDDQTKRA